MVLFMIGFRFETGKDFKGKKNEFNVIVEPDFSFFLFVCATISSLIITHIIIHKHRGVYDDHEITDGKKMDLGFENKTKKMVV